MDYLDETDFNNVLFLLEDLMLYALRSEIYDNTILTESAKVDALTIVENHVFTEDEILLFISTDLKPFIERNDVLAILESESLSIQDDVIDFLEEGFKEMMSKRKEKKEVKKKEKEQKDQESKKLVPGQTRYKLDLKNRELTTTSLANKEMHDAAKSTKEVAEKAGKTVDNISHRLDSAERKAKTGLAVLSVLALLAAAGYVYKKAIDKCRGLSGSALLKCRYNAARMAKEEAEKRRAQCKQTKNPEKCVQQANSKIEKYKKQMEINKI